MEKWQDPETLAIWFGIILIFVLLLVASIITLVRLSYLKILTKTREENQLKLDHQRVLLETNIEVQERERERIAADLHDELIGKLTAIRLTNQVESQKGKLDEMINQSIIVARRITHDLSPPLIDMTALHELITDLIAPWKNTIDVVFDKDIRADFPLKGAHKIQLKRITQEILTNTAKHAAASKIEVRLRQTHRFLVLEISDNGKGLNLETAKKGLGLKNIESRAQFINANYKIKTQPGKGTSFLFILAQPNSEKQ